MNYHVTRFREWKAACREFLQGHRGRASELARYLAVDRRLVSRWFGPDDRDIPDWAVLGCMIWHRKKIESPYCRPALEDSNSVFVVRSQDKRALVAGSQDKEPCAQHDCAWPDFMTT